MNRMLVAGNTVKGFVNFFADFIKGARTTFLKGGSGVGKSTFIRQVEKRAKELGYEVVEVPCSSDINSLDAIKIIGLNLVVLDATSPHIFEPQLYGIDGDIFDLGKFLDEKNLQPQAGIMFELLQQKKQAYQGLYNELETVKNQYENIDLIYQKGFDIQNFVQLKKDLYERINFECATNELKVFVDYIDGTGYHNICNEYIDDRQVISVVGRCEKCKFDILESLAKKLDCKKIRYEKYYSILNPNQLYAIGLKNMFVQIASSGEGIDTDKCFNMSKINMDVNLLLEHRHSINYGLKRASDYYQKARLAHAELEKIYLKAMDFASLEKEKDKYINNLFLRYWHKFCLWYTIIRRFLRIVFW